MKIIDIIKISFSNLFRQKMRTLLTVASIVIGSTLISIVYAIIPGFEKFFDSQLNTLSSPLLIEIYPTKERPGQNFMTSLGQGPQEYNENSESAFDFTFTTFKDADLEKVRQIEGVNEVYESPMPSVSYVQFENNDKKFKAGFVFYYPEFLIKNINLVAGEYIKEDNNGEAIVAEQYAEVLGLSSPDELVGKKIVLTSKSSNMSDITALLSGQAVESTQNTKSFELEVVGVLEKTILSDIIFVSYDDALEMTKFSRGTDEVLTDNDTQRMYAWIELFDAKDADKVMEKVHELNFSGMTYEQSKNMLNSMFGIINIAFSSFGILAMAVSSLGILNTLIMAVYERTREIGVMKALGATRKNVAMLFTAEAFLIGLFGGLIGLIFGFSISYVLNFIAHKTVFEAYENLNLANISPMLLVGLIISTVVSTISGLYPAFRASRLDPVKALRYE